MQNNDKNQNKNESVKAYNGDTSDMRKAPGYENSVPGVNTPNIELPAVNPPVPNKAWTEMKKRIEIESLSEDEKRDLYIGHDGAL